jgi:hypothetical protein
MDRSLSFVEFDVVLQAIVSYDVYPAFIQVFRETFRGRQDQDLSVREFVTFLAATVDKFSRESVFARLTGQLAYRNVAPYDQLEDMLNGYMC